MAFAAIPPTGRSPPFDPTVPVTSVLTEYTLVEIGERRLAVDGVGGDALRTVAPAVPSRPLVAPLEFASCVPSVIPALTAAALSFVLEVALDETFERAIRPRVSCAVVTRRLSPGACVIETPLP